MARLFHLLRWFLALTLCVGLALPGATALARDNPRENSRALADIAVTELPKEARDTLALIRRGGPFAHKQDGLEFGNREKRLPARERGYYREYTVPTPGARDRGARRIVAGGESKAPSDLYYTDDHYKSFRRIRE